MSFPRTLSSLRFTSLLSFFMSVYIIFSIFMTCLLDRGVTPDLATSFYRTFTEVRISGESVFNSMPLVLFSYMYQTNIPMIYEELDDKSPSRMWRVLLYGTFGSSISYIIAGVFGYMTFSTYPNVADLMNIKNILLCYPENSSATYISLFGILGVLLFNTPLTVLPCKDTLECLILPRGRKFS